jgi:hypothetical protein
MTTTSISFDLSSGERLLWSGAPRQGVVFQTSDVFAIPFSLLWAGFAIFWETMVLRDGTFFFALWGIPFVLIGLYITIGRFFYDSLRRSGTSYGLTSDRVIIASRWPTRSVKSFSLATLTDLSLDDLGNGTGTILFGPRLIGARWSRQSAWGTTSVQNAFEMIPDAKHVFDLIGESRNGVKT